MSENDRFRVDHDGHVARVTLCQGDEGNTVAPPDMRSLGAAIREAGSDTATKIVLLTGEGADFCLGRRHVPGVARPTKARDFRQRIPGAILGVYQDVRETPVPVLAAVQGRAQGFGCALVAQCDIAIAEAAALFSLPEMDANLPPTLAISACLPKMPAKAVLHMVLTRGTVDATQALNWGLVSEVTSAGGLGAAIDAYLAKLVDRDRDALIAIKEYMGLAPGMAPEGAARYAANLIATEMTSQGED